MCYWEFFKVLIVYKYTALNRMQNLGVRKIGICFAKLPLTTSFPEFYPNLCGTIRLHKVILGPDINSGDEAFCIKFSPFGAMPKSFIRGLHRVIILLYTRIHTLNHVVVFNKMFRNSRNLSLS